MKKVPLSEIKDDLSKYLRLAASEEIIITRHGKPAGVLVGFESEDDWFDYRLEHDPAFLSASSRPGRAFARVKVLVSKTFQVDSHRPAIKFLWSAVANYRSSWPRWWLYPSDQWKDRAWRNARRPSSVTQRHRH